jgi:hypothetical protein
MVFLGIRHPKKSAFLMSFSQCGNVTQAASDAGVERRTHYDWMQDPGYAKAFGIAQDRAARELEDTAVKRAVAGSDTLLIFLLKCRNRAVFGDHASVDHAGGVELKLPQVALENWIRENKPVE